MGMWCARSWRKRAQGVLAGACGARALGSYCLILLFLPRLTVSGADLPVQDIFGRDITQRGITLVDWEGYLANPLIRFYVFPPTNAVLPATATKTLFRYGERGEQPGAVEDHLFYGQRCCGAGESLHISRSRWDR